jgi:MSHA biogenesis protein MshM
MDRNRFRTVSTDAPTPPAYASFYGLHESPFSLAADLATFYPALTHASAVEDLVDGLEHDARVVLLIGDPGSGKTLVVRVATNRLARRGPQALVPGARTRSELLKTMLVDFGAAKPDDFTTGALNGAKVVDLRLRLRDFLLAGAQADAVLVFDQAHDAPDPVLDEIRILSEMEPAVRVVLLADPIFDQRPARGAFIALQQRAVLETRIAPLTAAAVGGYIAHRLERSGGSADRIAFAPDAVAAIASASAGVPRHVNALCHRALQQAYGRRAAMVTSDLVARVEQPPASASAVMTEPAPRRSEAIEEPAPPAANAQQARLQTSEALDQWLARIEPSEPWERSPLFEDEYVPSNFRHHARKPGAVLRIAVQRRRRNKSYTQVDRILRRWRLRTLVFALLALTGVVFLGQFLVG